MRRILAVTFLLPALLMVATPARAATTDRDARVVLTGGVVVPKGEQTDDVVVFNGPVTIDGDVRGSVVVFNGDTTVSGTIRDNLVVFNGAVSIASGARVGGDVATRETPSRAPDAFVGGRIRRIRTNLGSGAFSFLVRLAIWLAYSLSTLALGALLLLLAPRALEAARRAGLSGTGPAIGWGFALFVGLPIAAILAIATLVGIPLGLAVLLALWLLYTIGYVTSAFFLGRSIIRPPSGRFLAFFIGWLILRGVGLIPFVGGWVWFAGAVFGLGMLLVAMWRARTAAAVTPPGAAYAGPPVPPPPA